ncbi:MAG: YkvA family protein [Anaerolineae bacterium]
MKQGEVDRSRSQPDQERELLGWLREFLSQFELAWNLLWDGRVPLVTKLVPLFVLIYLLVPTDIIPDVFPGLGQVDDMVLILVGLKMFISLCPPKVVADHRKLGDDEDLWESPDVEIIDLEPREPSKDIDKLDNKDI